MATLGDISFRLAKEFPGVDPDVRLGVINDRYREILQRVPWSRQDVETTVQTVAQYNTGTVAVANGATALTFTDSTITAAMTGRQIHIQGRSEPYTLTYVSASTGTIDRPFEGDAVTDAGFFIAQSILTLPANCRFARSLRNLSLPGLITKRDRAQGDVTDPGRSAVGQPQRWNEWMDDISTPPRMQVELYPAPDNVYSIQVSYTAEQSDLAASDTSVALKVWTQPGALLAGCRADLCRLDEKPTTADSWEVQFEKRVAEMVNEESRRQGATQMSMQSAYTRHRVTRWAGTYRRMNQKNL